MTATAQVRHKKTNTEITITLSASELPEMQLTCNFIGAINLRTFNGELVPSELVRILCGSGMAFARQTLGIANGIAVDVSQIQGTVDRSDEVGICHATSIAIARSLHRDATNLFAAMHDWQVLG